MGPRAAVRVNWPAEQILKLVEAISLDESAIQTYFPKSSTQAIGKLKQSKKFCSKFFKDDPYMLEMERLGYVYRNSIEDEWNIEKWLTVDTHDPIYEKALALKKNFDKLTKDHGIKDKWRSFEDIKKREKRVELQKAIPYYFILKQLCQPNETHITPQPLIIPDYQSSSFSQPRKRKQRSLSIISILSSDSDTKQDISKLLERFQSDTPISPVRAPTSKRVRRAVPTSSPDIEEEIREATTPLRELSISIEHRGYIYQDEQIEIPDIHNGHVQDLDQQPEANLNPDSNSESDSDDASNRLSISPSSSSPSSTCSQSNADTDSSESIHLYTPQLGSFPRPSKTRRSVINNTVPNPASALPDGPGRMDDDAIEMEDETVDGTNANTACTHDELRSGIATLGDPQRPLIASFDDPHPAHSPSANKDNEIDPIDPHATVEEVEIYLKTKSALDPAKLQRATEGFLSRANKSGGKALKVFKADLRKWVQQTQPKNYQKRITNRGRMEMGLEIIRRRLQTTDVSLISLSDHYFYMPLAAENDYLVQIILDILWRAGALDRNRSPNPTHFVYLSWAVSPASWAQWKTENRNANNRLIQADHWITALAGQFIKRTSGRSLKDRVKSLTVECPKCLKSQGTELNVYLNKSLPVGIKEAIRVLFRDIRSFVTSEEKLFEHSFNKTGPKGGKRVKLGIRIMLSRQPDYLHESGAPVSTMRPKDLCDFFEKTRINPAKENPLRLAKNILKQLGEQQKT